MNALSRAIARTWQSHSVRTYSVTFAAEFFVLIAQFAVYKIAARVLGSIGFSEYAIAKRAVTSVQPLILLGLSIALPRFTAMCSNQPNSATQSTRYFSAAAFCMLTLPILVFALICLGRTWFAYVIFGDRRLSLVVIAMGLMLFGVNLHTLAYSYFRGHLEIGHANLLQLCTMGLTPIIALGISSNASSALMLTAAGWIVIAGFALFRTPLRQFRLDFCNELKELLRYGSQRVPGDCMFLVMTVLPATSAVHLFSIEKGGEVAFGISIALTIGSLFSPIGTVLLPKASQMISQGQMRALQTHLLRIAVFAVFFTTAMVIAIEMFGSLLVRAYLGSGFEYTATTLREVMPVAIPMAVLTILRPVLEAYYRNAVLTFNIGIGMIIYLVVTTIGYYLRSPALIIAALIVGMSVSALLSVRSGFRIFTVSAISCANPLLEKSS